ncbi:MAG: uracil-DNA glycosylase [Rhodobacter sp.]|nr:uracil-DNA glycosylase [Rhodobacter sp.]
MVRRLRAAIDAFIDELSTYETERVFNPWAMNCEYVDVEVSFTVRRENLRAVLIACAEADEVDVWIGRDLGWRGGRRTGVALVDEASLDGYAQSIEVETLRKATVGPVMRERTATEIHLARSRVSRKLFFWNVFPFHPHESDKPQSNRMHTRRERNVGLDFLTSVLALIPVERVVTIGNDAAKALESVDMAYCTVRHPSYGGQKEFHRQIDSYYGLSHNGELQADLFGTVFSRLS